MKLLVSDFDNTFYIDDDNIKKNVLAINKFRKNKNLFMLSSGRSFNSLKKMCLKYNISYDYLSCSDGSVIYDNKDQIIKKYNLNENILEEFIKLKDLVSYIKIQYSYPDDYYDTYIDNNILGCNIVVYTDFITNEFKFKFYELKEKYLDYDFLVYDHDNITYFCLKNKGINKSKTIKYLEKKLNILKEDIYTIGDNENDYFMLKDYQGYSVGKVSQRIFNVSIQNHNQVFELVEDILKSV